jgi:hypothetical protein
MNAGKKLGIAESSKRVFTRYAVMRSVGRSVIISARLAVRW